MKSFIAIAALLFTVSLTSCEFENSLGSGMNVTGKVGEILVVCDQGVWDSQVKASLDSNLTQWIMPYLPDVATFELIHKTPEHFTKGIKRYRNTLFLTIDPKYKGSKGSIRKRKDVWAQGQLVITVKAKSINQLIEICDRGLDEVHDEFDEFEWKRLITQFKENKNESTKKLVRKNFGIDIVLPKNSKVVTNRKNFVRIEFPASARPLEFKGAGGNVQDAGNIFSGLMIYHYDYTDSTQFAFDRLLMARDTMLKYNVAHEIEGLYMGTQYEDIIYPEGEYVKNRSGSINGFEMRGMFKFVGRDFASTGGAFWAYHFVNPKTKKLVCLSGYLDAPPTTSWTHPLREIQAILRSVEIKK